MKILENLQKWAGGLFKDESGTPSSKRLVGILCAITLCITMYHNSFSTVDIAPAQYLVDAVALLAFSTLGLSSVDKFISAKKDINSATSSSEPVKPVTPAPSTPAAPAPVQVSDTCTNCECEPCVCNA
jgi:hypothetical protein